MRQKPTGGGRRDSGKPPRKSTGGGRPSGDRKPFRDDRDSDRPARGKRDFDGGDRPKRSFDKPERGERSFGDDNKGSFRDPNKGAAGMGSGGRKSPYSGRDGGGSEGGGYKKRPYSGRDGGGSASSSGGDRKRPYSGREGDRPRGNFDEPKRGGFDKGGRGGKSFGDSDRPKRSFDSNEDRPKRSYGDKPQGERRSYGDSDRPKRSFDNNEDRPKRSYGDKPQGERRSYGDSDRPKRSFDNNEDRPKRNAYGKPMSDGKSFDGDDKPRKKFDKEGNEIHPFDTHLNKAFNARDKKDKPEREQFEDQTFEIKSPDKMGEDTFDKPFPLGARKVSGPFRKQYDEERKGGRKLTYDKKGWNKREEEDDKQMTLNKYIAHSGKCSRRDAAEMVKQGKVKVNGELALDPGYRVQSFDIVTIAGKKLTPQRDRVYVLLNKPKDFITTNDDPEGRKTVMDLVSDSEMGRLFPVGRLDRNTTGLLLMTNDGELAQKLSHPSYDIKKVYQVTLNKPLTKADFEKIATGVTLDDGEVKVDAIAYLEEKTEIGLEIHSGRNRIVRRIFESLGYDVDKLDRVMYAGLTKKNLPRGKWRVLNEKEIILLKHFKG
ncbi:MAG: pseudouridine synthase [Sphingobacteriales bacterium]|nr:MAG: pseudouridine synthase [Sphingobacteriales bacterium]